MIKSMELGNLKKNNMDIIEQVIKEWLEKEGRSNYVSCYSGNIESVCLDGDFNLKKLCEELHIVVEIAKLAYKK